MLKVKFGFSDYGQLTHKKVVKLNCRLQEIPQTPKDDATHTFHMHACFSTV